MPAIMRGDRGLPESIKRDDHPPMILDLFNDHRLPHPLADDKALKKELANLAGCDDLKIVDEIGGWLESIANSENFPLLSLHNAIRDIDEYAQPHLRRLTRLYIETPKQSGEVERRIWKLALHYWISAADAYALLIETYRLGHEAKEEPKGFGQVRAALPLIFVRLINALGAYRKWLQFHYRGAPAGFWKRMGAAYLAASKIKGGDKPVQIYPLTQGATTTAQEYLKALVLEASSPGKLKPAEVELAEKLIAHFIPRFSLVQQNREDNLYWVDAARDAPPSRLARLPDPAPSVRLIGFGEAPEGLANLIRVVERGVVPKDLALGGEYSARAVLKVLSHIASYWAPAPPMRQHHRHSVHSTIGIRRGFEACMGMFDEGTGGELDFGEAWAVENVSLGGFGVRTEPRAPAAAVGDLLVLQPGGGENWLVGIVRRFARSSDGRGRIGIESLTKSARKLQLRLRGGTGYVVGGGDPAVLLDPPDEAADSVRVLLSAGYFDPKESYDIRLDDQLVLVTPVELVESGPDYQVARFRLRTAE
jgi:hypothetical protein